MTYTRLTFARLTRLVPQLVASLTIGLVLVAGGCAEGGEPYDDSFAPPVPGAVSNDASSTGYDAGWAPASDAGSVIPPVVVPPVTTTPEAGSVSRPEAGTTTPDAGTRPSDAGSSALDASGGFVFPDLFGDGGFKLPDLFPASDASAPTPSADGGRDVNGPCKDLNLLCFDIFDMWINAECQTCNGGKGCQGCAIPFAY